MLVDSPDDDPNIWVAVGSIVLAAVGSCRSLRDQMAPEERHCSRASAPAAAKDLVAEADMLLGLFIARAEHSVYSHRLDPGSAAG